MAKRTDEQKREWRENMASLSRQIREMPEADRIAMWERIGTVTCEGHGLSMHNTCLLAHQAMLIGIPAPVQIGGFKQWQKVGRMVRKGQHACGYILVPVNVKRDKTLPPDAENNKDLRFRFVPVFDVSQTEEIDAAVVAA